MTIKQTINFELVQRVAKNSRLQLSQEELVQYTKEFEEILKSFEILQNAPTQGVQPSFQPIPFINITRNDTPASCLSQEESLRNAVQFQKFIKGPRLQ
ncbi:MAG: Asp-tRNA(Asn)/Glu-tRNA(Gln) amidotransferase subunit GatC [Candidatus Woesearchaeota archaeon]|nr:Asp-tRNA(Asn)/Glu-tRNA(Gln) amidotransferase subunit GatC [Candidatus Woesearchaeota archaeon]